MWPHALQRCTIATTGYPICVSHLGGECVSRLIFVCMLLFILGCSRQAGPTVTLVYKIDQPGGSKESKAEMDKIVTAVTNRLKRADIEYVAVTPNANSQISVMLRGVNPKLREIKNWLGLPCQLEFRIVADRRVREHAEIVALAGAHIVDLDNHEIRDSQSNLIGKWVGLGPQAHLPNEAIRRRGKDGEDEFVVVMDPYDVTGELINNAYPSDDGAAVYFQLNDEGAKLLGELTQSNLPDPLTGLSREVAIILDGKALSAATIRSKISSSGQVTGKFSRDETQLISDLFNAGGSPIPVKLTLVRESTNSPP
jgi:preprotein translocase subunit SecD